MECQLKKSGLHAKIAYRRCTSTPTYSVQSIACHVYLLRMEEVILNIHLALSQLGGLCCTPWSIPRGTSRHLLLLERMGEHWRGQCKSSDLALI